MQEDLLVFNPSDLRAEVKAHPLLGVSPQNQIGEFSPKYLFERMLLRRDDVDGKSAAEQGRRRLHRDETSAHDSNASAGDRLGENASAVPKGPQHHHMRQVSSRDIQSSWSGARGEKQLLVGSLVPVRQAQSFVSGVDLLDAFVALEVDAKISQGMPGDRQSVVPEAALEIVLREKRPVIGLFALLRESDTPLRQPSLRIASAAANPAAPPPRSPSFQAPSSRRPVLRGVLRAGRLHAEAVIIELHRIFQQSVESGSRCRFAGCKVEACMMPRTADARADDNAFVQRTAEVRAVGAVRLQAISVSPDETRSSPTIPSEDSPVGRPLDFDPLG